MNMLDYFGESGLIAKAIDGFEMRPAQIDMAKAVWEGLENCRTVIAEAGTGVGKSLAYLIPAIIWANANGGRVIVSTYSKALQQQLMEKELPFLKKVLDTDFDYAMAMGNANYLCRRRLNQYFEFDRFETKKEAKQAAKIYSWAGVTKTGLKSEIDFELAPEIWEKVCRESDMCLRGKCSLSTECSFMKERSRLRKSHIVVVNHHLYFAHLAAGETILPSFQGVIFDEAHCIEEAALHYFGIEMTAGKIKYLADNIYVPTGKRGLLTRLNGIDDASVSDLKAVLSELRDKSEMFFEYAGSFFASFPARIRTPQWIVNTLSPLLRSTARELKRLRDKIDSDTAEAEIDAFIRRAKELALVMDRLVKMEDEHYVYWAEASYSGKITLKGSSVNIGDSLSKYVFSGELPVILASATLSTDGTFGYIKKALGIRDSYEYVIESPFDYKKNALIYMPSDLPDPVDRNSDFEFLSADRIAEIASITHGRCLALFTSYRHLNLVWELISAMNTNLNIFRQGDMPHLKLVEAFRCTENSLLLATSSFWQGVDIPGEDLSAVIIAKLPFSVPDEPLTEAKGEFCREEGGNPFMDIQLPEAVIWLKQGFGRLIRTSLDRGIVAILDKRIMTKFYGKKFLSSLPKCRYTTRLDDLKRFLEFEKPSLIKQQS